MEQHSIHKAKKYISMLPRAAGNEPYSTSPPSSTYPTSPPSPTYPTSPPSPAYPTYPPSPAYSYGPISGKTLAVVSPMCLFLLQGFFSLQIQPSRIPAPVGSEQWKAAVFAIEGFPAGNADILTICSSPRLTVLPFTLVRHWFLEQPVICFHQSNPSILFFCFRLRCQLRPAVKRETGR